MTSYISKATCMTSFQPLKLVLCFVVDSLYVQNFKYTLVLVISKNMFLSHRATCVHQKILRPGQVFLELHEPVFCRRHLERHLLQARQKQD